MHKPAVALGIALSAVLVVGVVAAVTTSSGSPDDAGTVQPPAVTAAAVPDGYQEVDLALLPRDQDALAQLALIAGTVPPAERESRRQAALPGAARAAAAGAQAKALGLTLISTTDTNLVVAGPPDRVDALFGSAPASTSSTATTPETLPKLPSSLTGLVLVAAATDQPTATMHPRNHPDGSLSQAELQRVFGVPADQAPPADDAPTVATLQFSDWHPSDLTAYVRTQHIYDDATYDPVAGGGFTAVGIDGGTSGDFSGAGEVSLDQEAIATMAPGLRQRAYFVPDSNPMGQADALNQVARDAASQRILTVSTSYGSCEADSYTGPNDPLLTVDRNAINNVLAAGVTFFAPSGDDGAVDCKDTHPHQDTVDSPASFPNVVAVGGTTVHTDGRTTTQTGWSGSGGGYSRLFPRPSYQDGAVGRAQRGVPDIAMDADDSTGLEQYDSTPTSDDGCAGSCVGSPVGGTSLAAPLAAAALAATLAAQGATAGVGDIHAALYAAPTGVFTDVLTGHNGGFAAGPGWDPMTGLGAPSWSAFVASLTSRPRGS
ncbi:MAG TPA: S8 family serine peptidase [Mycobacteriales bacterium]